MADADDGPNPPNPNPRTSNSQASFLKLPGVRRPDLDAATGAPLVEAEDYGYGDDDPLGLGRQASAPKPEAGAMGGLGTILSGDRAGAGGRWDGGAGAEGPPGGARRGSGGSGVMGPDTDIATLNLHHTISQGHVNAGGMLQRSMLISKELRFHGQITSDGGLAMDWETVKQMEQEFEDDGDFDDDETQEVLPDAFGNATCRLPAPLGKRGGRSSSPGGFKPSAVPTGPKTIVMMVVGTRGDIQPFMGIALKLKEYGHRIRIATHKEYKDWIVNAGLEFYTLGGDPRVLSEFVCKHRGVMPQLSTSSIKDVMAQSLQVDAIINSTYDAVTKPDPISGKAFRPDIIVANPPTFGHVHVAEKLGVPLHIIFTMPWTPTKFFPQPFARTTINMDQESHPDGSFRQAINWYSYFGVDKLQWMGMSSMITKFRREVLGFTGPMLKRHQAHALYYSKVPFTYIWSPSLADRPGDWPNFCKVVGFINVDLQKLDYTAKKYEPPAELQAFLDAGPPPVYIGFGSLVVDEPDKLTNYFVEGVKATGLRALIQKGWGGLGSNLKEIPPGIFLIDKPVPHDWLFPKTCAVVHHGGAGTTAMGLYCGKPTFIVPFFGDQPFWGAACHKAGVGPAPVAIDKLNQKVVVDALKTLICPACLNAAKDMQEQMLKEDGIQATCDHIHETLNGWEAPSPDPESSSEKSFLQRSSDLIHKSSGLFSKNSGLGNKGSGGAISAKGSGEVESPPSGLKSFFSKAKN